MAYVGEVGNVSGNASPLVVPVTRAPAAGNLLVARIGFRSSGTTTVSGVTDTKGNTWGIAVQHNVSSGHAAIAYTYQDAGTLTTADTISVAISSSIGNGGNVIVDEFGNPVANGLDQTATGTGSGTARDAGTTAATVQADELVVAAYAANASETAFTPGPGMSAFTTSFLNFGTTNFVEGEYVIVSATGAQTATGTGGASATTQGAMATFKLAASSGPQTAPVTGLGSSAALGSPTPAVGGVTESVAGIGSVAAFGAPAAVPGAVSASPAGVTSAASLGAPTATPGNVIVPVTGLGSVAAIGIPSPGSGSSAVPVTGLDASPGFGGIVAGMTVPLLGLDSAAAFGALAALPGGVLAAPAGIPSVAAFGIATAVDMDVVVSGLGATPQFGVVTTSGGRPVTFDPAILGGRSPTY